MKERIETNSKIAIGKPIIKGTRITVDFILDLLANGWTDERILKNYPQLKKEDIQVALESHRIRVLPLNSDKQ